VKSPRRNKTVAPELPSSARQVAAAYPGVWRAFDKLGAAVADSGPLSAREQRLVKLALAIGAGSEGATHSHVRRGLREKLTPADLHHVAMLAITTIGWPAAVKGMTWIEDLAGSVKPRKSRR
jgi:alkylhydroperoxidase/carboxymuconolactone decarboxylase family protein YurZ